MENRCVCCGEVIPEGQQVCKNCQEIHKKEKQPEWKERLLKVFLKNRRQGRDE